MHLKYKSDIHYLCKINHYQRKLSRQTYENARERAKVKYREKSNQFSFIVQISVSPFLHIWNTYLKTSYT